MFFFPKSGIEDKTLKTKVKRRTLGKFALLADPLRMYKNKSQRIFLS
jgi:hypothetical protein